MEGAHIWRACCRMRVGVHLGRLPHANPSSTGSCLPSELALCCFDLFADVVGITNYIDVGFQMVTDLSGAREAAMRLGASWQVGRGVGLPE